jgi:Uma2 family endonuclease
MATATTSNLPTDGTIADLLKHLGDIPPERIRLKPVPGTATEADVVASKARYNCLCELIDGVLVEKAMGYYESRLAIILGHFMEDYLEENDLGFVIGEAGLVRVEPGQVRLPDLSFFFWDRFPNRLLPPGSILGMVPDLAVEVLSPGNTKKEMARKRREYFLGGARQVWEVDPKKRTVRVYLAPDESTLIKEDGTLDGGTLLPGFRLSLRRWFERAGHRAGR